MKKSTKAMVIGSVMFVCCAAGIFAKDAPKAPNSSDIQEKNGKIERTHRPRGMRFGNAPMSRMSQKDDVKIMGTVSAVDMKNSIIKIKNADGKDVSIHVNPCTVIFQAVKDEKVPVQKVAIADIQKGTWLSVHKFNTETNAVEASNIFALPEGVELPKPPVPQFNHAPHNGPELKDKAPAAN